MDNQDSVKKNSELMENEEQINDIPANSYNRANVNYNVTLSNPNLNIKNSMDLNIKNNIENKNQTFSINVSSIDNSNINDDLDNKINNNRNNNNEDLNYIDGNEDVLKNENKEHLDHDLNKSEFSNNYKRVEDISALKSSSVYDSQNVIKKEVNFSKIEKKFNNSELKFIFLITLIVLIVIMFFPNIRSFISNLMFN